MATPALISVSEVVDRYLLKYKKSLDDAFIYTEHACDCIQYFNLYDGNTPITTKVTVQPNKYIVMPTDMVGFIDLLVLQTTGRWWSCTEQTDIITTTTFTGGVEGLDATIGEGANISQPKSYDYGAVGGVNDYNFSVDWTARRIYVRGFTTETVVLQYSSTGLEVTGTTYIPVLLIPVIDAYLLLKETYWLPQFTRERDMREKDYTKRKLEVRNFLNSLSYDQWRDVFLSITSQSLLR
jgi:hypothetical protein